MHLNSKEKLAHDYRHLAEKVGLKQVEIRALERLEDPTNELLQKFGGKKDGNLGKVIQYLKELDRFDVIDVIEEWLKEECQAEPPRTNV